MLIECGSVQVIFVNLVDVHYSISCNITKQCMKLKEIISDARALESLHFEISRIRIN